MKRFLRVQQVAEVLGVHPQTVYAWIRRGLVPAVRLGRVLRVPAEFVELGHRPLSKTPQGHSTRTGGEEVGDARC
jgi:excisionase family DNA binding protein